MAVGAVRAGAGAKPVEGALKWVIIMPAIFIGLIPFTLLYIIFICLPTLPFWGTDKCMNLDSEYVMAYLWRTLYS